MDLLVIPLQISLFEREGNNGIAEKIHTIALGAIAEGIAYGHIDHSQFGIDCRCFPDAATVAFAANPGWSRDIPALIGLVLWNSIEVPDALAGLGIDCQHI